MADESDSELLSSDDSNAERENRESCSMRREVDSEFNDIDISQNLSMQENYKDDEMILTSPPQKMRPVEGSPKKHDHYKKKNDHLKVEESKERKGDLMTRMKKNIASKTASTSMGRKAIAHFLGDTGVCLLKNFKSAAKKDKDEATAKSLKKLMMKTALKAKILLDNGTMVPEDYLIIQAPSQRLLFALSTALSAPETSAKDIEDLSEMFSQITVLSVQIYGPHLTRRNVDKLRDALNYWGSRHFLERLINESEFKEERDDIVAAIDAMTSENIEEKSDVDDEENQSKDIPKKKKTATKEKRKLDTEEKVDTEKKPDTEEKAMAGEKVKTSAKGEKEKIKAKQKNDAEKLESDKDATPK